jgi:hypothetical protein
MISCLLAHRLRSYYLSYYFFIMVEALSLFLSWSFTIKELCLSQTMLLYSETLVPRLAITIGALNSGIDSSGRVDCSSWPSRLDLTASRTSDSASVVHTREMRCEQCSRECEVRFSNASGSSDTEIMLVSNRRFLSHIQSKNLILPLKCRSRLR